MLNVVMLSVAFNFMLKVIILKVIMLNNIMLKIIVLNVSLV
jgi:hypothetical protein